MSPRRIRFQTPRGLLAVVTARALIVDTLEHEVAAGRDWQTSAASDHDLNVVVARLDARQIDNHIARLNRNDAWNGPRIMTGLGFAPTNGHRAVDVPGNAQQHAEAAHLAHVLAPSDHEGDVHRVTGGIAIRLPVDAHL